MQAPLRERCFSDFPPCECSQLSPAASHRLTAVLNPAGHAAKPPACRGRCPPLRPDMRRIVSHLEIRSSRPSFTPAKDSRASPGPLRQDRWPGSVRSGGVLRLLVLRRTASEEAIVLRLADCHLPDHGWGTLTLARAAPHTARAWTGTNPAMSTVALKHRPESPSRPSLSPCSTPTSVHAQVEQESLREPARTANPVSGAVCAC